VNCNGQEPLLAIENVGKNFGGINAIMSLNFCLQVGGTVSLIGPNGAGKTTLINVVTGVYAPDRGTVHFFGEQISGKPAHIVASKGIGRTFQLGEFFDSLTVLGNAMVGCHTQGRSGLIPCGLRLRSAKREEENVRETALENLRLVGLEKRAIESISQLPLGERKLVGIARALGMKPRLLLLDEPAGGLAHHEVEKLVYVIRTLVNRGITILLVEHNMPFVMAVSERIIVLDRGLKIAEGPPTEIRCNPDVVRAYLGEEY